jgi:hypothetical protein
MVVAHQRCRKSFERPERYEKRRVAHRLNRSTLVEYLDALGILVDDPSFFGNGVAIRQIVDWDVRRVRVDAWRTDNL